MSKNIGREARERDPSSAIPAWGLQEKMFCLLYQSTALKKNSNDFWIKKLVWFDIGDDSPWWYS